MPVSTKLGNADLVHEALHERTGTWRATFKVDYELNDLGRTLMNSAANDVGGIELVIFDQLKMTLTIIVAASADPEATIRLWWKKFRNKITDHEPMALIGGYSPENAMAVSSESSTGTTSGNFG